MEESVLNIKKIRITCKECKTEVIAKIGRSIYSCPDCGTSFQVQRDNDYFIRLKELLTLLRENHSAEFAFICEEEVKRGI